MVTKSKLQDAIPELRIIKELHSYMNLTFHKPEDKLPDVNDLCLLQISAAGYKWKYHIGIYTKLEEGGQFWRLINGAAYYAKKDATGKVRYVMQWAKLV